MIPDELRARPQWVGWHTEQRNGKPTKVPLNPRTGHRASSTDPATWGTFPQAAASHWPRVGFVFSPDDPYVGIDMDACFLLSGALHPVAWRVVRLFASHTEFSPSGHGLHIIVRGSIPRGRHTLRTEWGNEIAVYSSGRFFTMGGESRYQIRDAQPELDRLFRHYFPPDEPRENAPVRPREPICGNDAAVVTKLLADPRMARLWAGDVGDHGGDHSAADLALCAHLAFYTGFDPARVDGLFRRSGLMRDKWDEKRGEGTYGSLTVEKAIRGGRP